MWIYVQPQKFSTVKPYNVFYGETLRTEVLSCAIDQSHVHKDTWCSALTSKHSIIEIVVVGFAKYVC